MPIGLLVKLFQLMVACRLLDKPYMSRTILTLSDVLGMDKQPRTNLINSLPGIRAANLIGTINKEGITNLAIFNSVVHIGANPPLIGFIMRPVSAERHTYEYMKQTGCFTINHVHEGIYRQAHQTSARYAISEFEATGLTPEFGAVVAAPYVKESKVKIGLSLEEELPVQCNGTLLIIGKIQEIILEGDCLNNAEILQLEQSGSIGVNGLETYYSLNKLAELPYAKP
jgi:flavin reductase (DIM6/NTAB) family NADH-FMN oxidoreductase RutF